MFKNAQIGDRVWDVRYGWGEITELNKSCVYSLTAKFINNDDALQHYSYTVEGKATVFHNFPILFWNEFKAPSEAYIKPLPKLTKDTKVLVWDENDLFNKSRKHKRYFSHFSEDGKIYCYEQGCTSWSATTTQVWDNWELYKEHQC
jgi:hypothetical protein